MIKQNKLLVKWLEHSSMYSTSSYSKFKNKILKQNKLLFKWSEH